MKDKKNYTVIGVIILVVAILGWIYISGGIRPIQPNLEFTSKPCEYTFQPLGPLPSYTDQQLNESTWLGEKTLFVKAYVGINCAEKVDWGSYAVEGSNLILSYKVPACYPTKPCAECSCAVELDYKITNLEKKDYNITFKLIR